MDKIDVKNYEFKGNNLFSLKRFRNFIIKFEFTKFKRIKIQAYVQRKMQAKNSLLLITEN